MLDMRKKWIREYGDIADRLRISRLALGHTPTTISRLIGMQSSYWHNCESRTRRISVDRAIALKRRTGLTLEWIFDSEISTLPKDIADKIIREWESRGESPAPKRNGLRSSGGRA